MINPMYFYLAEKEGLLKTREGRLNAVIRAVKNYPSPVIPDEAFQALLEKYDLTDLTEKELRRIKNSI